MTLHPEVVRKLDSPITTQVDDYISRVYPWLRPRRIGAAEKLKRG